MAETPTPYILCAGSPRSVRTSRTAWLLAPKLRRCSHARLVLRVAPDRRAVPFAQYSSTRLVQAMKFIATATTRNTAS